MFDKKRLGSIRVVAAVIEEEGRYLVTQRRPTAVLPLLWEFPGGKVEPEESDANALKRELLHRLGVDLIVRERINSVSHDYEKYSIELHLYDCAIRSGEPVVRNVHQFRWVLSSEFDGMAFTPADERSMSQLLGLN
jgi:8-oxo-dGTP diphosphatase